MTKTEIKNIIKEVNTNLDITWKVLKNGAKEIVLANSYLENIDGGYWSTFQIKCEEDEDGEVIKVMDTNLEETVGLLWKNYEWETRHPEWNDYSSTDGGFKRGIQCAVRYFNHCY